MRKARRRRAEARQTARGPRSRRDRRPRTRRPKNPLQRPRSPARTPLSDQQDPCRELHRLRRVDCRGQCPRWSGTATRPSPRPTASTSPHSSPRWSMTPAGQNPGPIGYSLVEQTMEVCENLREVIGDRAFTSKRLSFNRPLHLTGHQHGHGLPHHRLQPPQNHHRRLR